MSEDILSASGLDRQLGFALRHAYNAVWGDLVRTLEPFGLKPQSYATLLLIETAPGCKQQDIADALGILRPNIVALIDRMVEAGWIDRQANTRDRRSYALVLTLLGRELLEASRAAHDAHEARTLSLIGGEDRAAIARIRRALAPLEP